jgi:Mrp family chromosome partitioning ATPase
VALVAGLVLLSLGGSSTVTYSAEHLIAVRSAASNAPTTPSQAVLAATRKDIPALAAKKLGYKGNPAALTSGVSFSLTEDRQAISITASGDSRKAAQAKADAFAEAFVEFHSGAASTSRTAQASRNKEQLAAQQKRAAELVTQYPNLSASSAVGVPPEAVAEYQQVRQRIEQLQQEQLSIEAVTNEQAPYESLGSSPATESSSLVDGLPAPVRFLVGLLIGLGLGAVVLFVLEHFFPRIDTVEDLEDRLGAAVIAEVPEQPPGAIAIPLDPAHFDGLYAEAHRGLRTAVDFARRKEENDRPPVIMVVSAGPSEGKTMTSSHLALAIAETGREVVALSCDFRRPNLHKIFGVPRDPGINSGFENPDDLTEDIVIRDVLPSLSIVPSGPPTRRMVHLVPTIREISEQAVASGITVIVDTAPILAANDTADLLEFVDYVIVVAMAGRTHARAVSAAAEILRRHDAKVLGAVLVGANDQMSQQYSYYYSYSTPK